MTDKWKSLWQRYHNKIHDKFWAWLVPAITTFVDVFVLIIPSDLFVVLGVLSSPKLWRKIFVSVIVTNVSAYMLLYWAMSIHELEHLLPHITDKLTESSSTAAQYFNKYGYLSVFILSFTPFPVQVPVILCALSGVEWHQVLGALLIARSARYALIIYGASTGHKMFQHYTSKSA